MSVDLAGVPPTGAQGQVTHADLDRFLGAAAGPAAVRADGVTETPVIGLRRKIAERMAQSTREIPHFTYVEEVDVTALESLRQHLNAKKAAGEAKLTLLPFIGLALVRALREFPQCNAHYDSERNVILRHEGGTLKLQYMIQVRNDLKPQATVAGSGPSFALALPGGMKDLEAVYLERDGWRIELLYYRVPGALGSGDPAAMNARGLTHL